MKLSLHFHDFLGENQFDAVHEEGLVQQIIESLLLLAAAGRRSSCREKIRAEKKKKQL